MFPLFNTNQRSKKRKCVIYQKKDGSLKELSLKVHRKFILFRFFNDKIPESFSPLVPTIFKNKEMREVYKCVLYSYLSYKDRTIIDFPPEIKIEYEQFDSDVGKIPFFIVFDSTINSIVVGCRGSSCMDDFITDSLGNGVSYDGGKFHEGVFSTASYIFMNCQSKLIELNEKYNSNVDQEYESSCYSYDYDYSYDYYYSDSEEKSDNEEEEENQLLIDNHVSHHMSNPNNKIVFCHKSISEPNLHTYHEQDKSTHNNIPLNESHNKKYKRSSSTNEILQSKQSSNNKLDEDLENEKLNSNEKQHKNHQSSSLKNENSHHHHKTSLKSTDENLHVHYKSSLKSVDENPHHSHHNLKLKENSIHNDLKEKENKKRRSSSLEHGASHDDELESNEQHHKNRRSSSLEQGISHRHHKSMSNFKSHENMHSHSHHKLSLNNEKAENQKHHKDHQSSIHEDSHKHHASVNENSNEHNNSISNLKTDESSHLHHKLKSSNENKKQKRRSSSLENVSSHDNELELNKKQHKHRRSSSLENGMSRNHTHELNEHAHINQQQSLAQEKSNKYNDDDFHSSQPNEKHKHHKSLINMIFHHKAKSNKNHRSMSLTNENSLSDESNSNEESNTKEKIHENHHSSSLINEVNHASIKESNSDLNKNSNKHKSFHSHSHHKLNNNSHTSESIDLYQHHKTSSSTKLHKNQHHLSLSNKNSISNESNSSESDESDSNGNSHKMYRLSSKKKDKHHLHRKSTSILTTEVDNANSHHIMKQNEKAHKNHRSSSLTKENAHNDASSDSNENNKDKKRRSSSLTNLHSYSCLNSNEEMNSNRKMASSEDLTFTDESDLNNKRKVKIIITGHSLGAAVAGVVAYLFREKFPELDVHAICFAPPPTLTFNLWKTTGTYIKSFMIEGDIVPFLSVLNVIKMSDIMFPSEHFKNFVKSYLEKQSIEDFQENFSLNDTLYPPGQMYLIRFTNEETRRIFGKKKRKKNDVKTDEIQLCQILNPDYFSNLVKNIQEFNHVVKNYMRLIIRLMSKFKKINRQNQSY